MAKQFSFEADDKNIEHVLFSNRKFRVPRYQRPYAWTLEQASEFWNDMLTNTEPYFLGSLVFCTESQSLDGFSEIIDGQQRLLTITVFMAVLRDIVSSIDKKRAMQFQRQDIAMEDRSGQQSYRIDPDESLMEFFRTHIQKDNASMLLAIPKTPQEVRLKQNYEYFHQSVTKELERFESQEDKLSAINRLREKVSNLVVIDIAIEREEDAYEIFETTNARGVDLSVSDLLKNLIFKKIPAGEDRDFAKDVWGDITESIQATDTELKKFIRYFWQSKFSQVTEKRLYREIKSKITDWNKLLDELWGASTWYNKLLEGDQDDFDKIKNNDKIYDSLVALRLMEVRQCYVLLLAIVRNYDALGTDPTRIFEMIEKFTFQYSVICSLQANKVEKVYSKYAIEIENTCKQAASKDRTSKIQSLFSQLQKELDELRPSHAVFEDSFISFSYRSSEKSRRLTKYVLSRIDSYYRATKENRIDFNNVNIEHVLPQNPDQAWGVTKKEITPFVNLLGNLTLVDKRINSKVQNKPIKDKLPELEKSTLPITQNLVKELKLLDGKWSQQEINQRQKTMCDLAYHKIWNF